ncbi:MAG: prepilin-type N-terminal cleavage/methylation domain-containing protein [Thiotrichaceae bacterium]|nr:prepilin-type N-terminal cleavage/methylation domain-containing protein [Thiotrichaceae bacterium]
MKNNKQKGLGLLEVMIVVVITGVGLLGIAKLQLFNNQSSLGSSFNTQATEHLEEMIARLRSNKSSAIQGDYNTVLVVLKDLTPPATNAVQAKKGRYNWLKSLSSVVPNPQAAIQCETTGLCALAIHYQGTQEIQKHVLVVQL